MKKRMSGVAITFILSMNVFATDSPGTHQPDRADSYGSDSTGYKPSHCGYSKKLETSEINRMNQRVDQFNKLPDVLFHYGIFDFSTSAEIAQMGNTCFRVAELNLKQKKEGFVDGLVGRSIGPLAEVAVRFTENKKVLPGTYLQVWPSLHVMQSAEDYNIELKSCKYKLLPDKAYKVLSAARSGPSILLGLESPLSTASAIYLRFPISIHNLKLFRTHFKSFLSLAE